MAQATDSITPTPALPAIPRILVCCTGGAFIPAIYHPDRKAEYLRFERFPRKAKTTGAEALRYAERALWWRQHREAEKQRRLEALQPRFFLEAAE